jgi:hypothetical protein
LYLPPGSHDLTVTATGYAEQHIQNLVVSAGQSVALDVAMVPLCEIDIAAEAGSPAWSSENGWWASDEYARQNSLAWTDSPAGEYQPSQRATLTSPPLDLSSLHQPRLTFTHRFQLDPYGTDHLLVEVSAQGQAWQELKRYHGRQLQWQEQELSLTAWDGQRNMRVRFSIESDGAFQEDGWYLDGIALRGAAFNCVLELLLAGWPEGGSILEMIPYLASP